MPAFLCTFSALPSLGEKKVFFLDTGGRQQLVFRVTVSQGAPMAVTLDLGHEGPGPWLAAEWVLLAGVQQLPASIYSLFKSLGLQ